MRISYITVYNYIIVPLILVIKIVLTPGIGLVEITLNLIFIKYFFYYLLKNI